VEIVLFAGFLLHAIYGIWVWWTNKQARPQGYAVNRSSDNSKLESRVMSITAVAIGIFLFIHIKTFFVTSRFTDTANPITMFERMKEAFTSPWHDLVYVVALSFLAFHLKHGFQSAFQTLGARVERYKLLIEIVGVVFWLLIPLAFISIPLYFLWAH
jgi:succinate dehydrogenase / fumarate reductase cytochrome b subunit